MPDIDDVADSTDWLRTPLAGLAPFESGLRCQVCKDFFTTPMITSCSHTFCSLCIRRYLSQEGRCPACRESDQEMKLRRNWTVEELVAHFVAARDGMLKYARQPQSTVEGDPSRPRKRRKVEPAPKGLERRSTRSQSKRNAMDMSQASQEPQSTQEDGLDSHDEVSVYGEAVQSAPPRQESQAAPIADSNDGLVECPCCTRRVKEANINAHLDRCMQGLPTSPEPAPISESNKASNAFSVAQQIKSPLQTTQKDRLPSINYALYTETSLRKKLKELGIPSTGGKELMRKRHIEWVNLWNANCDSSQPRTKRDLLKDLDTWERTLGRQIERGKETTNGVMVKDFDREGWMKTQKGDFDDLIKQAREKRKAKAVNDEKPTMDAVEAEEKDPDPDTPMNDEVEASEKDMQQSDVPSGVVENDAAPGVSIAAEMAENGAEMVENGVFRQEKSELDNTDALPDTKATPAWPTKPKVAAGTAPIDLTSSPAVRSTKPANMEGLQPADEGTPAKRSRFFT